MRMKSDLMGLGAWLLGLRAFSADRSAYQYPQTYVCKYWV